MRFLPRLMLLALLAGAAAAVMRRLTAGGECSVACACSGGGESCACGHPTCLAPAEA